MNQQVKLLKQWIEESDNIVFFGGAGVSTESGIPDFRSSKGIFNVRGQYSPEEIVSHTFFYEHPQEFYDFYRKKMVYPHAEPNDCHKALSLLEKKGKLKAIITQNIDGLHQKSGSKEVIELHGTIHQNHCVKCHKSYPLSYIIDHSLPTCSCGGLIKPDVILYEEPLDDEKYKRAERFIAKADLLIIGGTSLVVFPASFLIRFFKGKHLVIINKSKTPYDNDADLVIDEAIGEVFQQLEII